MTIVSFTGIYDADGGVWGETRYIVGHMFGLTACSLCDITHSPIRRKPEWDAMVARLGVPCDVRHRNEMSAAEATFAATTGLPVVLAHHDDGNITLVLTFAELDAAGGSVGNFEKALMAATTTAVRPG